MCSWLFIQWGGGSIIATTKIVSEKPLNLFFLFFFQTVSSLPQPLQATKIEELSYVKKHLDVYDSKMILMFMT